MDIHANSGEIQKTYLLTELRHEEEFLKVGIATFTTYVLLSDTNVLTADKAFVSLALFHLLRNPLNAFPNVINSVVEVSYETLSCDKLSFSPQAHVSNKRIQRFLSNEEIDEDAVDRVPMGTGK